MIAVDTNVLLRHLLNDDADQSERAHRLFDDGDAVLITDVVLAETIWTLSGKRYGARKNELVSMLERMLEEAAIQFEDRHVVWSALNDYVNADPIGTVALRSVGFTDALIVNKARAIAAANGQSYKGTYTYDRAALMLEGTKEP
jgi:predicted nucleic-acid-binding protein